MAKLSFALLASALSTLVAGQFPSQTQLPEISAPADGSCGGCYVVADVAGIVFGGVMTQTAVRQVSVGMSPNGTNVTSTSIIEQTGVFTFDQSGLATGTQGPVNFNPLDTTIVVGGATLTSPTSYEVFSAYSVTSRTQGANGCEAVRGSRIPLPSAYQYKVPEDASEDFLIEAEESFISALGLTCSAGGGNVQSTIQSMLSSTTVNSTTAGPIRPTPVAASAPASASATTASSTMTASTTQFSPSAAPSGAVSSAVSVATTTVIFANSSFLPTGTGGISYSVYTPIVGAGATAAPALAGGVAMFAMGIAAVFL